MNRPGNPPSRKPHAGHREPVGGVAQRALQESEERYRRLLASVTNYVYTVRVEDGKPVETQHGPGCAAVTGYTPEEYATDPYLWYRMIHDEDRPRVLEHAARVLTAEGPLTLEHRLIHKDGSVRWVRSTLVPHRDAAGRVVAWDGLVCDISERETVERARRESEERYRHLFETMEQGVVYQDADGLVTAANPAAERILGLTTAEMNGRTSADPRWQSLRDDGSEFPGEAHPSMLALRTRQPVRDVMIGVYNPREGQRRWLLVSAIPQFRPAETRPFQVFATFTDITELRRAQESLRTSEGRFRSLFDNMAEGVALHQTVYDAAGHPINYRLTDVNRRYEAIVGLPREAVVGRLGTEAYGTPTPPYLAEFTAAGESGRASCFETYFPPMDKHFAISVAPLGHGEWATIFFDITERKRAEAALRESETNLAAAERLAHLGSWSVVFPEGNATEDGRLWWSDEVFRIFGYAPRSIPVTRPLFLEAVHPADRDRLRATVGKALREHQPYEIEHRIVRPDGTVRILQEYAEVVDPAQGGPGVRLVGTVQDITEQKKLEEELRQAQKMEAIGQLAGGVAHDFNNILTVILGHVNLVLAEPGLSADVTDSLQQAAAAAERAANLTRQLLTFSRKQPVQLRRLSLNEVLSNLTRLLRPIIGEDVALDCEYAPHLPPVEADLGMLEQVILNLTVNARDAMPHGGRLLIHTEFVQLDTDRARAMPAARAGDYVCLRVQDTGCGIAADVLPKIFEPFFTTKEVGKGTGLGLATVYGIVQQHHGWVAVDTQLGRGTGFRIYLPACKRDRDRPVANLPATPVSGGTETVFVVEDESSLRSLMHACLRRQGYQVLQATNGPEALAVWNQHQSHIHLLLTDLILPGGLTGRDLAERFTRERPGLRVLFTSGYANQSLEIPLLREGVNYLPKPFEPALLVRLVRACLDAGRSPEAADEA